MTVPNNRAYPRFTPKRGCVFCKIIAGRAKAEIVREWTYAVAFVPLNPVIEGHVLVAPREHLSDAQEYPWMTGRTFCAAADLSRDIGCAT
jgi:histidine triad (HIT) family protein